MTIKTNRIYNKKWARLNKGQQTRVLKALRQFIQNPRAAQLRVHQLKGGFYPQYSISAGGDIRIHFLYTAEDSVVLTNVGTHAQLYK